VTMLRIILVSALISSSAMAADVVIKQTDKYGNVQAHKPGLVIKGDKVYQTDKYGNVQYHKPSGKIEVKK